MTATNPVRFVVWLLFLLLGIVSGFLWGHRKDKPVPELPVRTKPFETKIRGEVTDVQFGERAVLVEWMKFDQEDLISVCRASEIIREGDKISLTDPILYDYSDETKTVTRTSGKFGEAKLQPGATRDLKEVKIWGDAMIFRYKAERSEMRRLAQDGIEKTGVPGIGETDTP